MDEGPCEYCRNKAPLFLGPPEVLEKSYLCPVCLKLLKDPATALPLIRGNLTMKLRGKVPADKLQAALDKYMAKLGEFRPRTLS